MFKSVRLSSRLTPDTRVIGVVKRSTLRLDKQASAIDKDGSAAAALKRAEFTGDLGQIAEAHPGGRGAARILIVGLGDKKSNSADAMRRASSRLGRKLAAIKATAVSFHVDQTAAEAGLDAQFAGQNLGEALGLLAFDNDGYRGKGTKTPERLAVKITVDGAAFGRGVRTGLGLAAATNESRRCSQTPPNICNPPWMAAQARALARKYDTVTVQIIKGDALKKERMVGHINVGQASATPPCLIRIAYKPKRSKAGAKPAVFVGKTITYDSGGLSIKPPAAMAGMKYDMDGGAAVLGAMHAVAGVVKPNRPVVALLACAENAISSNAYRPDDILTFRNGVTAEITNTDAEGRLVLADALCWACAKEKPEYIVDLATLTGGVITALGSTFAGMWCAQDKLRAKVEAAAERAGEPVWRLPLNQEYRDMMRSPIADILNSNPNRKAHATQGAAFLSYFVEEDVPWCHIDIAGMHAAETDEGMCVKGTASGFGARLLAELVG